MVTGFSTRLAARSKAGALGDTLGSLFHPADHASLPEILKLLGQVFIARRAASRGMRQALLRRHEEGGLAASVMRRPKI